MYVVSCADSALLFNDDYLNNLMLLIGGNRAEGMIY